MLVDVVNRCDELIGQLRKIVSRYRYISRAYMPGPQHLGAVSIGQP
jgi:hypothetical protein